MFKGIHNEAEFYTNFYFDNKLSSDLQSKLATFADIKEKTEKLKGLESFYWTYRDAKPSNDGLLEFYQKLLTVLGYQFDLKAVDTLKETSLSSFAQVHAEERTNLYVFLTNEIEEGTFETAPLTLNIAENPETRELSEVVSEFFDELENPPKWILVGSPTTMFLLERNKWAFGKYIKFNWDEVFQQKTDDLFSSILGLISKESLCPSSGQSIHAEMDDNSHRHAFEVTTELRESVRESIELLINEMIYQKKEKHQAYLTKDSSLYAKELSHDALFYAYRLIFLLFLEAQAEDSELLPLKSEIYRHGYSLEKLLELIHDIPDEKTADFEGTFAFESLQQIFSLIYNGFDYKFERDLLTDASITNSGFLLKGIKSDLFSPEAVKHLKDIKLRNGVMLTVLRKLSLSSTGKGKNKRLTRVSYSNLGINQLGAVYESLLSYSGFFAQEDLHALKPASVKQSDIDNGKELDQIYLAPKSIVDKYSSPKEKKYKLSQDNFVLDENGNPKIYKKGSFVYRLAGRDRQKLASFYTPESLTKCTVRYSLKVLFENKKTLTDLWSLKILEPAMGSGAFLNEAVNQIADRILELEIQDKVKDLKTPRDKQKRLWEVKYELISKNVFGVDLNPTAIELARFSLWLNCIGAGREPPQFDGRLKIGNSLIGARFKKGPDGVYPWLLLDDGMMNYGKRLKDYNAEGFEKMQSFRKNFLNSGLTPEDLRIKVLNDKVDVLLRDLSTNHDSDKLKSIYLRLKFCGDLWCSTFFITPDELVLFPKKHEEFLGLIESALEGGDVNGLLRKIVGQKFLAERFFHWELEFPHTIANGGFDLILGNPPWLPIEWRPSVIIEDLNPIPAVLELNSSDTDQYIKSELSTDSTVRVSKDYIRNYGYSYLTGVGLYEVISSASRNTYKNFSVLSESISKDGGVIGLIHEDGILEEKEMAEYRTSYYKKLKYHFQFANEKKLFAEVDNKKRFSLNILRSVPGEVNFFHLGNLYQVSTMDACFNDPNTGKTPLPKNEAGDFETKGHPNRLIEVNKETLGTFGSFLGTGFDSTPLLNLHCKELLAVVEKISKANVTLRDYVGVGNFLPSEMINEVIGQKKGWILSDPGLPLDINRLVISGPNIGVSNPYAKQARTPYRTNSDYDEIELSQIDPSFLPRTVYKLMIDPMELDTIFPKLLGKPYRSWPRLATRGMMKIGNERSVFMALIPPGAFHINGINSIAINDNSKCILLAGIGSSLLFDSIQRLKNKENFSPDEFEKIPVSGISDYHNSISRRAAALNCITPFHSSIWEGLTHLSKQRDSLLDGTPLVGFGKAWDFNMSIKEMSQRNQAQVEIDALVALTFDLDLSELILVYQVLFPVLAKYDRQSSYDRSDALSKAYTFFKDRGW